jgi:thiamine biosynthesis lipoprotein
MRAEHERSFELFGSHVRLLIGAPLAPGTPTPELAALRVEALLRRLHSELTRFDPASALSALNDDPGELVATTPVVAMLVDAAVAAHGRSGGLVDARVIEPLERAGYAASRNGAAAAPLNEALEWAPPRRPATPAPGSGWDQVEVDVTHAEVRRPAGMRIDSGGLGKGLAADLAAAHLAGFSSFAVDCGGDLRMGGISDFPRQVEVASPIDPLDGVRFDVVEGGVATSGLSNRIWAQGEGYSHHLIDPGSGGPAWTGIVQATALAPSALGAEVLAKSAMLAGPAVARSLLADRGGLLVLDSGEVEAIGPIEVQPLRMAMEA